MRSRNPGLDLPVADKASVDLIALFQLLLDLALGRPQLIGWNAWNVAPGAAPDIRRRTTESCARVQTLRSVEKVTRRVIG